MKNSNAEYLLNGGLFEPINNYDWGKRYNSSNDLFSNRTKNDIEGSVFLMFLIYNLQSEKMNHLKKK